MFFLKHGSYILTVCLNRPRTKLNVSKSFEIIFKTQNRIQKVIKMNSKLKTKDREKGITKIHKHEKT